MNFPSLTSDTLMIVLLSLQRICRNLSHVLNTLDADVNSFRHLLEESSYSIQESSSSLSSSTSSSSSSCYVDDETNNYKLYKNEDFYEQLFDEKLEPKPVRVTAL